MSKKYKVKMMAGCLLLVLAIFLSACGGEEQAAEATADGNAQTAEMTADGNAQTAEATPEMTTEGREETSETTIEGREEISDHQNTDTKEETAMQLMYAQSLMTVAIMPAALLTKGVLRGGGDVRFLMFADVIFVWVCSVLLGYITGVVLGWPPFIVFVILRIDYLLKTIVCLFRYRTDKWIKNIKVAGEQ